MRTFMKYIGIVSFVSLWSFIIATTIVYQVGSYTSLEAAFASIGATEHDVVRKDPFELKHDEAVRLYGDKAEQVWSLVGDDATFREEVLQYGPELLVPLIWTYVWKPDVSLDFGATLKFKNLFRSLTGRPEFDQRERGMWVVTRVHDSGENFLRRYVVADAKEGTVRLVRSKVMFAVPEDKLARHIESVEIKVLKGEEVTREDMIGAGLEVVTIATGVTMIGKMASASHATRAAVYARSGQVGGVRGFLGATASSLPRSLGEMALKYSVVGLGTYLVFTHPSVVTTAFGELGKFLGLGPTAGKVIGWSLLFAIPLNFLLSLYAFFLPLFQFFFTKKKDGKTSE